MELTIIGAIFVGIIMFALAVAVALWIFDVSPLADEATKNPAAGVAKDDTRAA